MEVITITYTLSFTPTPVGNAKCRKSRHSDRKNFSSGWYEYSVNNMWSNTNLFYKVSTTIPGGLRISSNSSETLQLVLLAWSGGHVWTIPWRQGMQTPKKETKNQGLRVVFGSEIDCRNFDQYKITDWHCLLAMPTWNENLLVNKLWYCKIEPWCVHLRIDDCNFLELMHFWRCIKLGVFKIYPP